MSGGPLGAGHTAHGGLFTAPKPKVSPRGPQRSGGDCAAGLTPKAGAVLLLPDRSDSNLKVKNESGSTRPAIQVQKRQ